MKSMLAARLHSAAISARLPLTEGERLQTGEGDPVRLVVLPWEEV